MRRLRAFSLVDTTFALGLIGVIFVGMLGGLKWVVSCVQWARESDSATQLMAEKLDTLRLYSWDQLNTAGYIQTSFLATNTACGRTYTGSVSIANAPLTEAYNSQLKQVTVNLQWTSASGRLRSSQMSTFVAQYGMQSYIY